MSKYYPIPSANLILPLEDHPNLFCLAHIARDDEHYRESYKVAQLKGKRILLDNGAYELSGGISSQEVITVAMAIHPQEIVLSDILLDGPGTIQRVQDDLYLHERLWEDWEPKWNYMVVPQGKDLQEWLWSFNQLLALTAEIERRNGPKFRFGISRVYEDRFVGYGGRLRLLEEIERAHKGHQIECHLLGVTDLPTLQRTVKHPFVGSFDTAKPFYMSQTNNPIRVSEKGFVGKRPANYFDWTPQEVDLEVLADNIKYLDSL